MSNLLIGLEYDNQYDPRVRDELEQLTAGIQTGFNSFGILKRVASEDIALTGGTAMTWTRSSSTDLTNVFQLTIGTMMFVAFVIQNSTVGGTPSTILQLRIPLGKLPRSGGIFSSPVYIRDNAARTTGFCFVDRRSIAASSVQNQIVISRTDGANFTASAGATDVFGQLWFEVE